MLYLGITERKRQRRYKISASALNAISFFEKIKVKTFGFLHFFSFRSIFVCSLAVFIYASHSQTKISALNQAIPERFFALKIQFLCSVKLEYLDFTEFLVTQPL